MTKTEKTIAGTWYTITCTAAVTVTQEIDGEIATLATLGKSGTTTFRASASTITIQTEGKYHILPTKAPAALVGDNSSGGGTTITGWYEVLRSELDELLGAGNYKLDYHWEDNTAVIFCTLSLNASSEQVKDAERLLRRCAPGVVRVAVADVPLGFAQLSYLGTQSFCPIDTGITVSSDTGARVVALNEGNTNINYSALAGVERQFLVAGVNPTTKMISWAWGTPDTQASYTTLLTGETIPTADISSYPGKLLKYGGGVFTASLNYENNGEWRYSEGQQAVVGLLPAPDALSTNAVTLFARKESSSGNMSLYSWRGRIYEAQFSKGMRVVRNFVPVVNDAGVPCMFDTVSRSQFFGGDGFICGIEAQEQLDRLLRGLPDRTGQEVGILQVRLADSLQTEANFAALDAMAAKNWEISQAA